MHGELICVYMREHIFFQNKDQVGSQRKWPYKVIKRIGENAYKLGFPSEFQVSATLNVLNFLYLMQT